MKNQVDNEMESRVYVDFTSYGILVYQQIIEFPCFGDLIKATQFMSSLHCLAPCASSEESEPHQHGHALLQRDANTKACMTSCQGETLGGSIWLRS